MKTVADYYPPQKARLYCLCFVVEYKQMIIDFRNSSILNVLKKLY